MEIKRDQLDTMFVLFESMVVCHAMCIFIILWELVWHLLLLLSILLNLYGILYLVVCHLRMQVLLARYIRKSSSILR